MRRIPRRRAAGFVRRPHRHRRPPGLRESIQTARTSLWAVMHLVEAFEHHSRALQAVVDQMDAEHQGRYRRRLRELLVVSLNPMYDLLPPRSRLEAALATFDRRLAELGAEEDSRS